MNGRLSSTRYAAQVRAEWRALPRGAHLQMLAAALFVSAALTFLLGLVWLRARVHDTTLPPLMWPNIFPPGPLLATKNNLQGLLFRTVFDKATYDLVLGALFIHMLFWGLLAARVAARAMKKTERVRR